MKANEKNENFLTDLPIPLLRWFAENARDLPWRKDPTPYHVWISEIMLQQTRVQAVLNYYTLFLQSCPTVASLAGIDPENLMKLWQGLGYYSRARNMQRAAQDIMEKYGGEIPDDYKKLKSLPGIGPYTAGAIASIAFGLPFPAVDGNVLRVVARLTGDSTDISSSAMKKSVTSQLQAILPVKAPGPFNQALMELGATVCLPGKPHCSLCPVSYLCVGLHTGQAEQLPVKSPQKPRREEQIDVFLIFYQGRVALRRRPEKGLLAGLWEFPCEKSPAVCPVPGQYGPQAKGCHIFTHVKWHMTGRSIQANNSKLPTGWLWADEEELREKYAIPSAFDCFRPLIAAGIRSCSL